jgi:hypothetical protein
VGVVVRFPAVSRDFPFRLNVQTDSLTLPAPYAVYVGDSFPGVKRPGCEADHSALSISEVSI